MIRIFRVSNMINFITQGIALIGVPELDSFTGDFGAAAGGQQAATGDD